MAYFAPYLDDKGIHMPTYEERLSDLSETYRSVYGNSAELSASVPDYQLLSVFAKALDDTAALALQAYNARNPMYAAGCALDLLLPQYGLEREEGESDASVRARIRKQLTAPAIDPGSRLLSSVSAARGVWEAKIYFNDTSITDSRGIPPHNLAVVVSGGYGTKYVAQAVYDAKPPGIPTYGEITGNATDAQGNTVPINYVRATEKMIFIYPFITVLTGGDQEKIAAAVIPAITGFVNERKIGESLTVTQLYGVAYAADPLIANTFVIVDIQVAVPGATSIVRDLVPCDWNAKISTINDGGVSIRWTQ